MIGRIVNVPGMGQCVVLYALNDDSDGYRVRNRWTGYEFSAIL